MFLCKLIFQWNLNFRDKISACQIQTLSASQLQIPVSVVIRFWRNQYISTAPEVFKNKCSTHRNAEVHLEPRASACMGRTEPDNSEKNLGLCCKKRLRKPLPSTCIT